MRFLAPLVLTLVPSVAEAHAFTAGQGNYAVFVEGMSLVFHTPELTVCVLALGLLIGLWNVEGMPIVWPSLMIGAVLGLALPLLVVVDASVALYATALVLGALAILHRAYGVTAMRLVSAFAGAAIADGALSLHGLAGLPPMIPLGIFAGLNLFVPMVAGVASLPQRWIAAAWPTIGLRILASWLTAVTIMMFAFALKGVPA